MGTTAVFIDGAYLDNLQRDLKLPKINYTKLVTGLVGEDKLFRSYYYNCLPYQDGIATEYFRYKHKLFSSLSYIPEFEVKLGNLVCRKKGETKVYQQKQVDTSLATDMTFLACCKISYDKVGMAVLPDLTRIILVGGDEDFLPPAKIVKKAGINFTVCYGCTSNTAASSELLSLANNQCVILSDMLN